jgi:hypothetical protein
MLEKLKNVGAKLGEALSLLGLLLAPLLYLLYKGKAKETALLESQVEVKDAEKVVAVAQEKAAASAADYQRLRDEYRSRIRSSSDLHGK